MCLPLFQVLHNTQECGRRHLKENGSSHCASPVSLPFQLCLHLPTLVISSIGHWASEYLLILQWALKFGFQTFSTMKGKFSAIVRSYRHFSWSPKSCDTESGLKHTPNYLILLKSLFDSAASFYDSTETTPNQADQASKQCPEVLLCNTSAGFIILFY